MRFLKWLNSRRNKPSPERGSAREDFAEAEAQDEEGIDPFNPFPEAIQLEIRDVFDLHTIAPKDVKRVVEEYLAQARRAGYRSVRIIHGKGIGVQREIVRAVLKRTSFVEDWTDAPGGAGGWGATIVRFHPQREGNKNPDSQN